MTATMLPPFNLPTPLVLLITDELSSPADFLLHRALHQHLRAKHPHETDSETWVHPNRATVLSVSESIPRWKAVASRSNVNLEQHIATGSVQFIDVLAHASPLSNSSPPSDLDSTTTTTTVTRLKPIFDLLIQWVTSNDPTTSGGNLVILDDISTLEWIGFALSDLTSFVRALRAVCIKTKATLIVRHHRVSDEPDELFSHLYQMCTYHLEVRGLASGKSGSISGEVSLHAGPATIPKDVNLLSRSCAMQYRLTDTSAVFFEKGTGQVVL